MNERGPDQGDNPAGLNANDGAQDEEAPQGGDFGQQGGDFGQQDGDFGQQDGDFGQRGGDFGQQGGDFGQRGGDFGQQGGDFGQRGGDAWQPNHAPDPPPWGTEGVAADQRSEAAGEWDAPTNDSDIPGLEIRLKVAQMELAVVNRDVKLAEERNAFLSELFESAQGDWNRQQANPVPDAIDHLKKAYETAANQYKKLTAVLTREVDQINKVTAAFEANAENFARLKAKLDEQIHAFDEANLDGLIARIDAYKAAIDRDAEAAERQTKMTQALAELYGKDSADVEAQLQELESAATHDTPQ